MSPTHRSRRPQPSSARHHFLAIVASALALLAVAPPARANHLSLALDEAQPLDAAGRFLAAREPAHTAGQPDRFKIKGDLWIANSGASDVVMTGFTIRYPGTNIPAVDYPAVKDGALPAGGTGRMVVFDGLSNELAVPLPATVELSVKIAGTTERFTVSFPLAFARNSSPAGSYVFPMAAADLGPGQVWHYWNRHVDQGSTGRDRYAYDLVVVQWYDGEYIQEKLGSDGRPLSGNANSHFLAFGLPLYAVADGVVVRCRRGIADNVPGVVGDNGNELWIQHGAEVVRYSHIRHQTMPTALCPNGDGAAHDVEAQNVRVRAGQKIGEIGNTGQSTGPHLHISVHPRPDRTQPLDVDFGTADSRPLNFHNIRVASHPTAIQQLGANPAYRPSHGAILPSETLIVANPCGLTFPNPGAAEVSYHGVIGECHQDLHNLFVDRGYRPSYVDGYDVDGAVFFNAVYRPAGPANVSAHGLTGTTYQGLFEQLTEDDTYRLHQVDSYLEAGQVRYAAIFEKRPGPAWAAFHGAPTVDYEEAEEDLRDAGYVPVNVSATEAGGQVWWTALFERATTVDWVVETVPAGSFASANAAHVGDGLAPIYVHGFRSAGSARITGIWADPVGGTFEVAPGVNDADYQDAFDEHLGDGLLTRSVTGYDAGTSTRWAAVWRARPNTRITRGPAAQTTANAATFQFTADNRFTTFECALDRGAFVPCASGKRYTALSLGSHVFRVRAVDREGVRDATPSSHRWRVSLRGTR